MVIRLGLSFPTRFFFFHIGTTLGLAGLRPHFPNAQKQAGEQKVGSGADNVG